MTDRELLELAAKANGHSLTWGDIYQVGDDEVDCSDIPYIKSDQPDVSPWYWNPLEDDGDALRLAVKLGICFGPNFDGDLAVCFGSNGRNITEPFGANHYAATRRAIVRAAAEIGKGIRPFPTADEIRDEWA